MIRLETRTPIPVEWEEAVGPFGTMIVFDGRLNGKMWSIYRINTANRQLFYVKQKSIDGEEDMLCLPCSCAFRVRAGNNNTDPPEFGPRSVCAVVGNGIRNHAIKTFDFSSINPMLENKRLAIKATDNGENYLPYMTGYMAMGNPAHPDLIDLVRSKRVDYWEFKPGDYEA
jgi:hypothetical protein